MDVIDAQAEEVHEHEETDDHDGRDFIGHVENGQLRHQQPEQHGFLEAVLLFLDDAEQRVRDAGSNNTVGQRFEDVVPVKQGIRDEPRVQHGRDRGEQRDQQLGAMVRREAAVE